MIEEIEIEVFIRGVSVHARKVGVHEHAEVGKLLADLRTEYGRWATITMRVLGNDK